MGWFWADAPLSASIASRSQIPRNHPPTMMSGEIPPECPMHQKPAPPPPSAIPPECPMHTPSAKSSLPAAIPTSNILSTSPSFAASIESQPVETEPSSSSRPWSSYLNPLNMMPTLSNIRSNNQKSILPTERTMSTIPKGRPGEGNWEYPSPQQMYNAMLRKGYDGTDEDAIEAMVEVHNFLNEGAWVEIVEWEKQFAGGVLAAVKKAREEGTEGVKAMPRLARFMGRPSEPSPKARMLNYLGRVYPSKFGGPLPFDRHDWYVLRYTSENPNEEPQEVRYVIDYYSGEPEPTGEPVFYLDVRPALDRPSAVLERTVRWGGEVWYKASGAAVREEERKRSIMDEINSTLGK